MAGRAQHKPAKPGLPSAENNEQADAHDMLAACAAARKLRNMA
jgi:hypothetical protein